jgi:hypothetical protein
MMKQNLLIILIVLVASLPVIAHAGTPPPPPPLPVFSIEDCAPGHQKWEYTIKVVDCIEKSTKTAVIDLMTAISTYMTPIMGGLLTLVTVLFAIRIAGGEEGLRSKALGFALRAGFVILFSTNLGGYATSIFDIETQLVTIVSGGSPWTAIDGFVGTLLGVGPPPMDISKGLIGIVGAGILSSTPVGIMAFVALSAIINMLLFIYRVVFTYLTAIIMIGFLIAISPLVIPMALFVTHGERFFTKWLDILFSAMLTPILLFAFISVFVGEFQFSVNHILGLLQCGNTASCVITPDALNFGAFQKSGVPAGSMIVPTDPSYANSLISNTGQPETGVPAVQSNVTSQLRRGMQTFDVNKSGVIDFGPGSVKMVQELIYWFLALWIFASFMKSLIEKVPDLATNIAEAASYITMTPSSGEKMIGSGLKSLQTAITGKQ